MPTQDPQSVALACVVVAISLYAILWYRDPVGDQPFTIYCDKPSIGTLTASYDTAPGDPRGWRSLPPRSVVHFRHARPVQLQATGRRGLQEGTSFTIHSALPLLIVSHTCVWFLSLLFKLLVSGLAVQDRPADELARHRIRSPHGRGTQKAAGRGVLAPSRCRTGKPCPPTAGSINAVCADHMLMHWHGRSLAGSTDPAHPRAAGRDGSVPWTAREGALHHAQAPRHHPGGHRGGGDCRPATYHNQIQR